MSLIDVMKDNANKREQVIKCLKQSKNIEVIKELAKHTNIPIPEEKGTNNF